jgi:hypothetical protein
MVTTKADPQRLSEAYAYAWRAVGLSKSSVEWLSRTTTWILRPQRWATGHSCPHVDTGACEDCRKGSSDRERAD